MVDVDTRHGGPTPEEAAYSGPDWERLKHMMQELPRVKEALELASKIEKRALGDAAEIIACAEILGQQGKTRSEIAEWLAVVFLNRGKFKRWFRQHFMFEPRDLWIGYFYNDNFHYVCVLPTLVIRWARRRENVRS